jgi:hypothetical protein
MTSLFFVLEKLEKSIYTHYFYSIRKNMTQQEDFMREAIALSAKNITEKN